MSIGSRAILASALLLAAAPASAQSAKASDAAAAEVLWNEGRKLRAAGKIHEACPKFVESYRLDPAIGTLLNMASCHELEGKLATAWGEYSDAEQQARRAGDKREKFAADHAKALEPRLPRLVIRAVEPPPDLVVTRDGVALGAASLGVELPIDPGRHEVTASAAGRESWSTTIEVGPRGRTEVRVPPLAPKPEAPEATAPPSAATPPPDAAPPGGGGGGSGQRTVALVLGGVGIAAIGVGAVFGVLTANQASIAETECPNNRCNAAGDEAVAAGRTDAWVSNIGFGVGAVALLVGGYLFFSADPDPAPAVSRLRIAPVVGPHAGGASAAFAF